MSFKRGVSTLGCPNASLTNAVDLCRVFGIDALELRALDGSLDLPRRFAELYGTPQRFAEEAGRIGVGIVSLDTSLKLAGGAAGDREEFLKFVPWAEAAGVKWLRVFDGALGSVDEGIAAMTETAAWWRELKRKNGWSCEIMVETHDTLFTAEKILRFVAASPDTAILWDTHHTWKRGSEDPVATWDAIARHVVHIHVKDSVGKPSERHPFTYVLPGAGEFPAGPLMKRLRGEYRGVVCLEWEKKWHPYLPTLGDALEAARSRDWW